jgi:predicted nucleic acid-binding Zn finger protein
MGSTNEREMRGVSIAARCKIDKRGDSWVVPSQSGAGKYAVYLGGELPTCTCPDHETRGVKCKHIFAVEIVMKREENSDGSETITQSVVVTETVRKTYRQSWPEYNAAQTHEKDKFLSLLRDLCAGIQEPPQTSGRKRVPRCSNA